MKLNTKYHGEIEYEEKDIITFKKGLPGFEKLKKFILFPLEDNDIFNILHSIEDKNIGLVVTSPFSVLRDYEFKLDEQKTEELKIQSYENLVILNTVTLNSTVKNITINLKAPIIINIKMQLGEQIILDNPDYLIKYPLFKGGV